MSSTPQRVVILSEAWPKQSAGRAQSKDPYTSNCPTLVNSARVVCVPHDRK